MLMTLHLLVFLMLVVLPHTQPGSRQAWNLPSFSPPKNETIRGCEHPHTFVTKTFAPGVWASTAFLI